MEPVVFLAVESQGDIDCWKSLAFIGGGCVLGLAKVICGHSTDLNFTGWREIGPGDKDSSLSCSGGNSCLLSSAADRFASGTCVVRR